MTRSHEKPVTSAAVKKFSKSADVSSVAKMEQFDNKGDDELPMDWGGCGDDGDDWDDGDAGEGVSGGVSDGVTSASHRDGAKEWDEEGWDDGFDGGEDEVAMAAVKEEEGTEEKKTVV